MFAGTKTAFRTKEGFTLFPFTKSTLAIIVHTLRPECLQAPKRHFQTMGAGPNTSHNKLQSNSHRRCILMGGQTYGEIHG